MVKNLPANAGDMGLIFRSGKISHATEQLNKPYATTTEPMLYSPEATREATVMRSLCCNEDSVQPK